MLSSERFHDQHIVPTTSIPRSEIHSDVRMVDDEDVHVVYEDSDVRTVAQLIAAHMISSVIPTADIRQHMAT
jgi:hypothetical protein